jgi:hypothetical protein
MTVQECIDSSYRKLGLIQPGEVPSSQERADGMLGLNSMVTSWNDALKKSLAGSYASSLYTFVPLATYSSLTDALGVSPGWERAYVFNLAIEMATEFGRSVPPEVAAIAQASKVAVVTLATPVI